jgi:hypothetical protein
MILDHFKNDPRSDQDHVLKNDLRSFFAPKVPFLRDKISKSREIEEFKKLFQKMNCLKRPKYPRGVYIIGLVKHV